MNRLVPDFIHDRGPAIACRVYNSANIAIADSTVQYLTFDSETEDPWGFHSTSSNTDRITIPTGFDGWYNVQGIVIFDNLSAVGQRTLTFRVNAGSTNLGADARAGSLTFQPVITMATSYRFVGGDYVRMAAYQSSGGSLDAVASGIYGISFSVSFLGR